MWRRTRALRCDWDVASAVRVGRKMLQPSAGTSEDPKATFPKKPAARPPSRDRTAPSWVSSVKSDTEALAKLKESWQRKSHLGDKFQPLVAIVSEMQRLSVAGEKVYRYAMEQLREKRIRQVRKLFWKISEDILTLELLNLMLGIEAKVAAEESRVPDLVQLYTKLGFQPNLDTYNALLSHLVVRGQFNAVKPFVADLVKQGVQLDRTTFELILRASPISQVYAILREMDRRKLGTANTSTLDAAMERVLMEGDKASCKIGVDLVKNWKGFVSSAALSNLIVAHAVSGDPKVACRLWTESDPKFKKIPEKAALLSALLKASVTAIEQGEPPSYYMDMATHAYMTAVQSGIRDRKLSIGLFDVFAAGKDISRMKDLLGSPSTQANKQIAATLSRKYHIYRTVSSTS